MSEIKTRYLKHYTLDEAAAKLNLTVTECLHAAEDGLITLSYRAKSSKMVNIAYDEIEEPIDCSGKVNLAT